MIYEITESFRGDIESVVKQKITDEKKRNKGIEAFENLINIKDESNQFNQEYGKVLESIDGRETCRIEDFLRKIDNIKENEEKDSNLETSIQEYVKEIDDSNEKQTIMFVIYIEECIKNYEIIHRQYMKQVLDEIDYESFANKQINLMEDFNSQFLQLNWENEDQQNNEDEETERRPINVEFNGTIKFIGEAGLGKTTQMRKMFFDVVQKIKEGEKWIPIWIELSKLENEDTLKEKIKEELDECKVFYDLLLEENKLKIFLDGYNEILVEDIKQKIAREIDDIHKEHPDTFICLTDRTVRSIPPCLNDAQTYTYEKLNNREREDYILKKITDNENKDIIKKYLEVDWIDNINWIPLKLNMLIELLENKQEPEREDDFYIMYLNFIFKREEDEKKEVGIRNLKRLLWLLFEKDKLNSLQDDISEVVLADFWISDCGVDSKEANRLINLAIELPILVENDMGNLKFANEYYAAYIESLNR